MSRQPSKGENYWRQVNDNYEASGLSMAKFCQQQQVALSTLQLWRKKFRSSAVVPARFVEVELPVTPAAPVQPLPNVPDELVVELPYGIRLRFRGLAR